MNMLVLDLRGNRGGLLIQAVRVANTFLQRGQMIVSQKGGSAAARNLSPRSMILPTLFRWLFW